MKNPAIMFLVCIAWLLSAVFFCWMVPKEQTRDAKKMDVAERIGYALEKRSFKY